MRPCVPPAWAALLALCTTGCLAASTQASDTDESSSAPPPAPATTTAEVITPTPPAEAQEPAPSTRGTLRGLLSSMGVEFLQEERRLEVHGWVNMNRGLVEVFACAPQGKTHESVVVLDCVPSALHAGLLALGLEPGRPVEAGTDAAYEPPGGDGVEIRVQWTDPDGREHTSRAEDWVWDEKRAAPMPTTAWIFAGSLEQASPAPDGGRTYAADFVKSLVTTYHDATSVLENPWPDGIDDTVYYSNEAAVPAVGTPVLVSFSPAP